MLVDDVIAELRRSPQGQRCHDLVRMLESLHFRVRDGSRGGHKIVSHPGLLGWFGTNFDCGHRETGYVKANYVRKLVRVLEDHKERLRELNNGHV
jgi:hypothetical protein